MASFKILLFVCILVASVAVPKAEANILGVNGLINIHGILYCTVNGSVGAAGPILTPKFTNATVVLKCGAANTTIASVRTNLEGKFSMWLDNDFFSVPFISTTCRLDVTTPLAACNATLPPTQTLTSALRLDKQIEFLGIILYILDAFKASI